MIIDKIHIRPKLWSWTYCCVEDLYMYCMARVSLKSCLVDVCKSWSLLVNICDKVTWRHCDHDTNPLSCLSRIPVTRPTWHKYRMHLIGWGKAVMWFHSRYELSPPHLARVDMSRVFLLFQKEGAGGLYRLSLLRSAGADALILTEFIFCGVWSWGKSDTCMKFFNYNTVDDATQIRPWCTCVSEYECKTVKLIPW